MPSVVILAMTVQKQASTAAVLAARKAVLEAARAKNPRRWINGRVRDCTPAPSQFLNPDKPNAQAKA